MSQFYAVITTIQKPTKSTQILATFLAGNNNNILVVGDAKGPNDYSLSGTAFFSLESQLTSRFELARKLPINHYSRKNFGYLHAIAEGAECIYETDDDNHPLEDWKPKRFETFARTIKNHGWINIYKYFTRDTIWPRGFPLDEINNNTFPINQFKLSTVESPIQQSLVDKSPDVDAIWRLLFDRSFFFENFESINLSSGCWCPFNSQNTWWWPEAYPLMYLPSFCSIRMTDIWRSFIAQRCLWELGYGVVFHGADVSQNRNEHDLKMDFHDEIPGYTRNKEIVSILESLQLGGGNEHVSENLLNCYRVLIENGFFPSKEIKLLEFWLSDLRTITE